jgi:hypothetical protein
VIGQLVALTNAVMGVMVFLIETVYACRTRSGRWLPLLYSLVGLYWAVMYGIIFVLGAENAGTLGPTFFRPGFTVTLAVIAAGAIWRMRTTNGK